MSLKGVSRRYLIFLSLLISTALIFTKFSFFSFLFFLLITALLTAKHNRGLITQSICVYLGFFCFVILLNAIGSFGHLKISPATVLILMAAFTWALAFFTKPVPKNLREGYWSGILAVLLVGIYVSIPVLIHPSSAAVLRYSAKTDDDISHIARIEANRTMGGFLYHQQEVTSKLIDPGTAVSPQGWHVNSAFIESQIIKLTGSSSVSIKLLSYLVFKTVWLSITVFLLFMLLKSLQAPLLNNSDKYIGLLSFMGTLAISVLLIALYGYGFQDFIASIGLVCASLIVAIRYTKSNSQKYRKMLLIGLMVLGVSSIYVWTLSGGIVGLIILALLVRESFSRYNTSITPRQLLVAGLFAIVFSFPIYQLVKSGSERGIKTLNTGGSTPPISTLGTFLLFLFVSIAIYITFRKKRVWLLSLLVLAGMEFFFLAAYQIVALGEQRYYVIKLAFLFAVITSVFYLVVVARIVNSNLQSKKVVIGAYLAAIVLIPLILGLDLRKSAFPLKDSAPIKTATAKKILASSTRTSDKNVVFYTSNKEETYLANKLWSSVQLYNTKERKLLLDNLKHRIND